jgi:hypothetical protein
MVYRSITIRNHDLNWGCNPEVLLSKIQEETKKALDQGGVDLSWDVDAGEEYGDPYGFLNLSFNSPETDEERRNREKRELENERFQRHQYEILRKKFEGKR